MNAIRVHEFGPPEVMRLEALPDPVPGDGQVFVRLHAVGVNAVDTYIRAGHYSTLPAVPFIPGSDAAGIIEAVGDQVPEWRVGDRVYIGGTQAGRALGAYAELAVCDRRQVHRLSERVSFEQGLRSTCRTRRPTGRSSTRPRRSRARRCLSMARVAAWASPQSSSPWRSGCA